MASKSIQEVELLITAETGRLRGELDQVNRKLDGLGNQKKKTDGLFSSFDAGMAKMGIQAAAASAAIAVLTKGFEDMLAKEDQLADFSAITGVTGAKLKEFGDIATQMSNDFGTSVVENIEAFKGTLSRLGPGFAESTVAVQKMGESINILSKASGMDATESMDALTTAMLQFGVDLSNPITAANEGAEMMNVMAAAAKEGAAEIPQITQALVVAGTSAKAAGVSFEETNAAIQMLATGGIYGAEAGTALRNVFIRLQAPTQEARDQMQAFGIDAREVGVALTSQGLGAAMDLLKTKFANIADPVERAALLNEIFGESAQNAAQVLMDKSGPAFAEFTAKITDTATAQEQASVKMDTMSERFGRLTTTVQNFVSEGLNALIEHGQRSILMLTDLIGLTGDEPARNFKREKDSINSVTEGYKLLNPQVREAIENAKKKADAEANAALAAEQAAKREAEAKKKKEPRGRKGKSALELENEAIDKARVGIASLAVEWEGFNTVRDEGAVTIQELPGQVELMNQELSQNADIVNRMIVGYGSLGLTIGSVADVFSTAFSGGADALTAVLKQIGGMLITFVEGSVLAGSAYASVSALFSAGLSAIKDVPLLTAAIVALESARGFINSLAVGTTSVPFDQVAQIHKGEAVIPRTFNEGIQRGDMALVGGKQSRRGRVQRQYVDARVHVTQFASMSQSAAYQSGRLNR